jgi:hypothetical protein
MRTVFEQIDLTKEMFFASPFTRLSELKYLQRTRQVDAELYWAKPGQEQAGSDQLAQDQPGRRQLAAAVD